MKKKDWIWIAFLAIGGICILAALCIDIGKPEIGGFANQTFWTSIKCTLWKASETVCNIIVTYSTMLAAVIVFFYSVIDNKRLGMPYRRLIIYTVGSHTIPVLFVVTIVLTVFMSVIRHIPWKYTVYTCGGFIFLMQIFMIINILLSTSYKHCKRVICRIERERYISGTGIDRFNSEWAYTFGHLERALHSEEFVSDKKELLIEFLWIPFDGRTEKLYSKGKDKKDVVDIEKREKVYQFYYVNILSAFRDFNGDTKHLERNQLYMGIRDYVLELSEKISQNVKDDEGMQRVYHAVLSGIINGLLVSGVEDGMGLCSCMISECIADHNARRRQLYLFVLFQEMLSMMKEPMTPGDIRIEDLGGWKPIEKGDVELCAEFWNIWTDMYDFPFLNKMQHFELAIQTMTGCRNRSMVILKTILALKENTEDGEKMDGKDGVNEDIASEE